MKYFHSLTYTVFITLLLITSLVAQDEPFRGGFGDGFSLDTLSEDFLDFTKGSVGDGYTSITLSSVFNDYSIGGIGDGFSKIESQNLFLDFTKGGESDGFSTLLFEDDFNSMYSGGVADGFSYVSTLDDFNSMYSGGSADGFAYDKYGHIIFWTGNVGTSWNVADNWENGFIPSYCNPVVIPSGVPNFPAVNAGLLRIGYYKDKGDYKCQRIKIKTGAEMTTRVNCFVENYDLIFNRGKLFVKNPAVDAFKNLGDGIIQLKPNSEIIFKE